MAGISFAKTVSDCELLKTALDPLLGEMPHLTPENAELEAFLNDVKALRTRQEHLTGELRQITRLRKEAEKRGQDLRSRVASQLRGKLGFKNEQLLGFGIPPRRKPVRRKEEEEPTAKAQQATSETPPAD